MARPVGLDVDTASGSETASTKTDISPSLEKRPKFNESGHTSSEKENYEKSEKQQVTRQSSQLRRQYSLDAQREKNSENKDGSSDRLGGGGGKGQDTLRERGQNISIPAERGRNRDKSPARHRYHSETRLSETDKRYMAHDRGSESDRYSGRQRDTLGSRQMDNKGRNMDEREGRRGHDKERKEPPDRPHPEREIIKKESAIRTRYIYIYIQWVIVKNSEQYEPCYEKTSFLHMRKQRRRSASQ